jgi:DeoR family transcriptional regulator, aga operon transcriptional repressor
MACYSNRKVEIDMDDSEEKQSLLLSAERESKILDLLASQGPLRVNELSDILDVSEPTIRRDLDRLEKSHRLRRVHGGAVLDGDTIFEQPVLHRRSLNKLAKKRIGKVAADLIKDGETIILLGGSTTLEIIPYLKKKDNLTVITDSILIAIALANMAITCVMLGGTLLQPELTIEGHLAELCLSELHANKVILGVRAINFERGLMLDRLSEIGIFRASIQAAEEAILVADQTKFKSTATAVLGPLKMVQSIVTDMDVQPEIPDRLKELGINVFLA